MGHEGLRGRPSPELTPGAAHTRRPAPSPARHPTSQTPPPWALPAPPSLHPQRPGRGPLGPPPPSLAGAPPPGSQPLSRPPAAPLPSGASALRCPHASRQPHCSVPPHHPTARASLDSGLRATLPTGSEHHEATHPSNSLSVLSPSSQYSHWPQLPPLPCPQGLPDPSVKSPRRSPPHHLLQCLQLQLTQALSARRLSAPHASNWHFLLNRLANTSPHLPTPLQPGHLCRAWRWGTIWEQRVGHPSMPGRTSRA